MKISLLAYFFISIELPNTEVSLIIQPNAASADVNISELVILYNIPAAIGIVIEL